jgi:hypothetical protein
MGLHLQLCSYAQGSACPEAAPLRLYRLLQHPPSTWQDERKAEGRKKMPGARQASCRHAHAVCKSPASCIVGPSREGT